MYELLWIRVEAVVIGALHHPPRPQYAVESLVDYTEACVDEVVRSFPQALVILAGDFNELSTNVLRERTGLTPTFTSRPAALYIGSDPRLVAKVQ